MVVDVAAGPTGPWREAATVRPAPVCAACNTYFAQALPWTAEDGALLVVLSNNAWEFADADHHPEWYRPSVIEIPGR